MVLKQCEICGKDYWVKPYKKNTAKYCSRKCLAESKKKTNPEKWMTKTCPSCGKIFETLISKEKKYCSSKFSYGIHTSNKKVYYLSISSI